MFKRMWEAPIVLPKRRIEEVLVEVYCRSGGEHFSVVKALEKVKKCFSG